MIISLIAAMSKNRVIGLENKLPWDIPEDMAHFRSTTMGKTIVMGRKTFESFKKALPKRTNIVITRNPDFQAPNTIVVSSLEAALKWAENQDSGQELFIIGGAEIYKQSLPVAHRIYLTIIDKEFQGDAFFPMVDLEKDFRILERREFPEARIPFTIFVAERR